MTTREMLDGMFGQIFVGMENASDTQRVEMRKAFYVGVLSAVDVLIKMLIAIDGSADEFAAAMRTLQLDVAREISTMPRAIVSFDRSDQN